MSLSTSVIERVGGIHDLSTSVYRRRRTWSTADSRAEEACTRRRNSREPSDDKSRNSRRSKGLRRGLTFGLEDSSGVVVSLCCVVLCSLLVAGGNAEACGAGGELDVGAGDMVWNIFGVDEEVMLISDSLR